MSLDFIGPTIFGGILGALLTSWVQTFVFGNRLTRLETTVTLTLTELRAKHDTLTLELAKLDTRCDLRHSPLTKNNDQR